MKPALLLTLILSFFFIPARAQSIEPVSTTTLDSFRNFHIKKAGKELELFHRTYTTGTAILIGSSVFLGIGIATSDDASGKFMAGVGAVGCVIGTIITLASHRHIRLAGVELQMAGTGVGIPIKSKKKR